MHIILLQRLHGKTRRMQFLTKNINLNATRFKISAKVNLKLQQKNLVEIFQRKAENIASLKLSDRCESFKTAEIGEFLTKK